MRHRVGQALNRAFVGRAHLSEIIDEHELGEVVVDGRPGQVRARRPELVFRQGGLA